MRILYVVRLFSGLETSVASGVWRPTGAPTGFKMIEALDRSRHEPIFVLTAKDFGSDWTDARDREVTLAGLRHPVRVLAGAGRFRRIPGPAARYLRELRQAAAVRALARRLRPDLVYVGNANVWTGAWLARRTRIPVVFRVMGVYPAMRAALTGGRPADRILRWAYRSPFAAAIVTQDGSGVEPWLAAALDPAVPRHLLVNGVDPQTAPPTPHAELAGLPADRTKVLFIGRLDAHKGADVFMRAFLAARKRAAGLHAVVIGTGPHLPRMRELVAGAGAADHATFIERLPHDRIVEAHARTDIYVSLNRYGNLSNANLEAMKAGQCMIVPAPQPATGIDIATERLVPPAAARRIPSADSAEDLAQALVALHGDPARRLAMRDAMRAVAQFIPSWDERVAAEMAILESLERSPR
jgi:glycosyltransferase involved in cell wall biosynthesis